MQHSIPDREAVAQTEHTVVVDIDPQLETDVVVRPDGLLVRLDADPHKVGQAFLAYLRTARRLALDDAAPGEVLPSLLDADTDTDRPGRRNPVLDDGEVPPGDTGWPGGYGTGSDNID